MGVSFKVRNISTGPFKVKFLPGTPLEVQKQVKCRLRVGERVTIPATLTQYVDKGHLNRCNTLGVISVKEIRSEASQGVAPPVVVKRRKGSKGEKEVKGSNAGDGNSKAPGKTKGANTQQGGD